VSAVAAPSLPVEVAEPGSARAAGGRAVLLAPFAGFCALAAWHWASLLEPAPVRAAALVTAIAIATAVALTWLERVPRGDRLRRPLALLVLGSGLALGLVAAGIPPGQLLPWEWDRLAANLDYGATPLAGDYELPLAAGGGWTSALLMSVLPVLFTAAAALAFAPRRRRAPSIAAVALLVAAVSIPTVALSTADQPIWGVLLLGLLAAWIWAPWPRGAAGAVAVALAAVASIPLVAGIDREDPLIGYSDWRFGEAAGVEAFEWNHSYGPIDWPRTGEPLFRVRSDQPRYWRADVLDRFDGNRWVRTVGGGAATPAGEPAPGEIAPDGPWLQRATFTVSSLASPVVLSPGTPVDVSGIDGALRSADGVAEVVDDEAQLSAGSDYSVVAYVPDPDPETLRNASRSYSPELAPYTEATLPPRDGGVAMEIAPDGTVVSSDGVAETPLFGSDRVAAEASSAATTIENSSYARVGRLAERLTAGAPTAYDAVKRVEEHLQSNYLYSEAPPERPSPLAAFLFRDRAGYCQQFSGAMALILRMSGIPTRVATGFTPGVRVEGEPDLFEVTDLEAHSWVEVYFEGIGWVPFDPTPGDAPAESQAGGPDFTSAALGAGADLPEGEQGIEARRRELENSGAGAAAADGGGGGLPVEVPLGMLAIAIGLGAVTSIRGLRHRSLPPAAAADLELRELPGVLARSGRAYETAPTLLGIESELRRRRLTRAADYVGKLRAMRFAVASAGAPTLKERRAARRDLASGHRPLDRLRILLAMPPGGPRRRGSADPPSGK